MAKIVLPAVSNTDLLTTINQNFQDIAAEFQDKVLYRDNPPAETNTFTTDLDLDGHDVFNVGDLYVDDLWVDGVNIRNFVAGDSTAEAIQAAIEAKAARDAAVVAKNQAQTYAATSNTAVGDATAQAVAAQASAVAAAASAASAALLATKIVDSIAQLKLVSKLVATRVQTVGYYTPGDGGGADYWYDPSDIVSADNAGTVIVAADGARWKIVVKGEMTVRHWGAKGDGVTDDSAAIQRAINSGFCVFDYSALGYRINTALNCTNRDGVVIKGMAACGPQFDLAYIVPVAGTTIIMNTGGYALDITGSNHITIRDLNFSNQTAPNPSTVGIVGGTSNVNRLGYPGGAGYVMDNVSVLMNPTTGAIPIYLYNCNVGRFTGINTLGKWGIVLCRFNPLGAVPPYTSFGPTIASDGNIFSGISCIGNGDNPLIYLEGADDNTFNSCYLVYAAGYATKPAYTGAGYAVFIKDCNDLDMKIEVDYFPYAVYMDGVNYRCEIKGITYPGVTICPPGSPAVAQFAGSLTKNCTIDVLPIGSFPNNNYHFGTAGGATANVGFYNCKFTFDSGNSANVAFFNTNTTNTVSVYNCTFTGNTDLTVGTTPMVFQRNGSPAATANYRVFVNGRLQGTG